MKKIVIDTNILVRYFLADIEDQYVAAKSYIEDVEQLRSEAFVSIMVIHELIWILEHYYELNRKIFLAKIKKLLLLDGIKIIETKKDIVINSLEYMSKRKVDFTDVYLVLVSSTMNLISFDKDIEKIKKNI